jgi:hypothetical protein
MPFAKGVSGNPNGRPRDAVGSLIRANKNTPAKLIANLDRLIASNDEAISLKATIAKIEFGWGKASQTIEMPDVGRFIVLRPGEIVTMEKTESNGNGSH